MWIEVTLKSGIKKLDLNRFLSKASLAGLLKTSGGSWRAGEIWRAFSPP
jgi:hypothetical protein